MPLSLVLVLGKVLVKLLVLPGLAGHNPPVQDTVGVRVHPDKAKLTGLGVKPAAMSVLIASTMLSVGLETDCATLDGTPPVTIALPTKERRPSYPARKKILSFLIGPPTTPPNCFSCVGNLLQDAWMAARQTPFTGAGVNILRASHASLRPKA